jgi:hypothetical protein
VGIVLLGLTRFHFNLNLAPKQAIREPKLKLLGPKHSKNLFLQSVRLGPVEDLPATLPQVTGSAHNPRQE